MTWVERRLGLLVAVNLIACGGAVALGSIATALLGFAPGIGLGVLVISAAAAIVCVINVRVFVRDYPPRPDKLVTLLTFNAMLAAAHVIWAGPALFMSSIIRVVSITGVFIAGSLAISAWACFAFTKLPTAANLCAKCGYDITGLPACPECGTVRPT